MSEMRENPEMKDKMHCLIFVVHAEKFAGLDEKILGKLTKIRFAANKRGPSNENISFIKFHYLGIPCLVVCTAIDKVCKHVEKDTSKVYLSQNIQKMVII